MAIKIQDSGEWSGVEMESWKSLPRSCSVITEGKRKTRKRVEDGLLGHSGLKRGDLVNEPAKGIDKEQLSKAGKNKKGWYPKAREE